jgi:PAS domain S-box-containing protein
VRSGETAAILALAHDVTERNFAEQALWASEAQMRGILETALDAIVLMDARGLVLSWNPRAEAAFGWPRAEAVGRRVADLIVPPRYREAHDRGLARYLQSGDGPMLNRPVELIALRRDGSEFPVALRISALRDTDRIVFCAFIEDISERKRVEEQVLASEKRYRALFESNPLPILLYEPDTLRILAVNPAAVRHYGFSEWEFRDRSLPDLWAAEEDAAASGEAGHARGARHRTKDGRPFDAEVTAQSIEYAGRPARIAARTSPAQAAGPGAAPAPAVDSPSDHTPSGAGSGSWARSTSPGRTSSTGSTAWSRRSARSPMPASSPASTRTTASGSRRRCARRSSRAGRSPSTSGSCGPTVRCARCARRERPSRARTAAWPGSSAPAST